MKQLEQKLFSLQTAYKEQGLVDTAPKEPSVKSSEDAEMEQIPSSLSNANKEQEKIPFVWIHDVAPGSPAEQDGFKIGDAIY